MFPVTKKGGVIQICLIICETILDEYIKLNSEWCWGSENLLFISYPSMVFGYLFKYELFLKNNFFKKLV